MTTKAEIKSVVVIASSKLLASVSASGVHKLGPSSQILHVGNNALVKRTEDFHGVYMLNSPGATKVL